MKKIFVFCLNMVIFSLISAVSGHTYIIDWEALGRESLDWEAPDDDDEDELVYQEENLWIAETEEEVIIVETVVEVLPLPAPEPVPAPALATPPSQPPQAEPVAVSPPIAPAPQPQAAPPQPAPAPVPQMTPFPQAAPPSVASPAPPQQYYQAPPQVVPASPPVSQAPPQQYHQAPPQPPTRTVVPMAVFVAPPAMSPSARTPMNITPGMPDPRSKSVYRVQLGAFANMDLARQCYSRLQSAGFSPLFEQYGNLHRVIIVGIKAVDMAWVIQRLDAAGFKDAWIREEK